MRQETERVIVCVYVSEIEAQRHGELKEREARRIIKQEQRERKRKEREKSEKREQSRERRERRDG